MAIHYRDAPSLVGDLRASASRSPASALSSPPRPGEVEEADRAVRPWRSSLRAHVRSPDDEALAGVEVEPVERPLRASIPRLMANSSAGSWKSVWI